MDDLVAATVTTTVTTATVAATVVASVATTAVATSVSPAAIIAAAVTTATVAATVAASVAATAAATSVSAAALANPGSHAGTAPTANCPDQGAQHEPGHCTNQGAGLREAGNDTSDKSSASRAAPLVVRTNKATPASRPSPNTKLLVSVAADALSSSLPTVCLKLNGKGRGAVSVPLPPPMEWSPSTASYSRTAKTVSGSLDFGDGRTLRFKVGDVASDAERERGVSLAGYVQGRDGLRRPKLLLVLNPELAVEASVLGQPRAA